MIRRIFTRQRFVDAVLSDNNRDFWSEVKRMNGNKVGCANVVDNKTNVTSISDHFASHYKVLYNSVPYSHDDMEKIAHIINERTCMAGYTEDCVITAVEVADSVKRLQTDKNDGSAGLSTNHFKFACFDLYIPISCLLSGMPVHGAVPDDFVSSTTVPIPEGSNVNFTVSDNYRGITLSSIFGKVLDLIVLMHYSDKLESSRLQFGFKAKHSTATCTMIVKEVFSYYVNNGSQVACMFLDATKAFDKLEYRKLFSLLLAPQLPPVVIRILLNMYTNQQVRVLWNGVYSNVFSVVNGVKQGGVISPVLFCLYMDELLVRLREAGVGCYVSGWFVGALAYADNLVLLAPSATAMCRLLSVCDSSTSEYNMLFNAKKSKCLIFRPMTYRSGINSVLPTFKIRGSGIENVDRWPHLGHIISRGLVGV